MQRIRTVSLSEVDLEQERVQLAMRVQIREHIQDMLDLADLLETPDATAADVRRGTVMSLRGVARLARYLVT